MLLHSYNNGLKWTDGITQGAKEVLDKYPEARLVKLPNDSAIYFLYKRPQNKWLKIALNSPTVFVSYSNNYWGNVITINKYDLDSYPDVQLIRVKNSSEIYYLENNIRHLVSAAVFTAKGFNPAEVAEVNQAHLESYKIGDPLK